MSNEDRRPEYEVRIEALHRRVEELESWISKIKNMESVTDPATDLYAVIMSAHAVLGCGLPSKADLERRFGFAYVATDLKTGKTLGASGRPHTLEEMVKLERENEKLEAELATERHAAAKQLEQEKRLAIRVTELKASLEEQRRLSVTVTNDLIDRLGVVEGDRWGILELVDQAKNVLSQELPALNEAETKLLDQARLLLEQARVPRPNAHKNGVARIAAERRRQLALKNYDAAFDDSHTVAELALAAICYAAPPQAKIVRERRLGETGREYVRFDDPWPWTSESDRRAKHSRERRLEIAGALIAAELDRLERRAQRYGAQAPDEGTS